MAVLTKASFEATGQHSRGPEALDSVVHMEQRGARVLQALIKRGYVRSGGDALAMQAALDEGTPYALVHLCDVLLSEISPPAPAAGPVP